MHLATFKPQAAMVSKISIVFAFSHRKTYVSKIYLAVKWVKVITGSYDELKSPMLHSKFRGYRLIGSGGEDF